MRNTVLLALAVPVLLFAGLTETRTTLPAEPPSGEECRAVTRPVRSPGSDGGGPLLGVIDTIGGTTYDWQASGPALYMMVNSPGYGIHALWIYSASDQTTFPDRNMRYNFYDYSVGEWNWIDPVDFMQSGVSVFTDRTGFGTLARDPETDVAVVSAHRATATLAPIVGRDMSPGAGIFEYCPGEPELDNYAWPWVAVDMSGNYHLATIDYSTTQDLYWSRCTTWCEWSPPAAVPPPQPQPLFPDHAITAGRAVGSQKVCIAWEFSEGAPDPGFYRMSTDGGASWENPQDLAWPPNAYGGDTATSYHISSLFPYIDMNDRLHFAANVMPYVAGTGYVIPAQIWHWCAENSPEWTRIQLADPDTLAAPVGYNALYACRQSMAEDANGNLFVVWEQFDSLNAEPGPPELLRADIWWSHSSDNGQTWETPEKITTPCNYSHRFPFLIDYITDTVVVWYEVDQVAGFFVQGEGPSTNNPIVVQKWENPYPGVQEQGKVERLAMEASAAPNPFQRGTRISYSVPQAGAVSLAVYDVAGRPVRELDSGQRGPGRYSAAWDGCSDTGRELAAGVYFYEYRLEKERVTGKLLLAD